MFFFVNSMLFLSEACCKVKIILQGCICVRSLSVSGDGGELELISSRL